MSDREAPWRSRVGHALKNPWLVLRRVVPARLQHLLEAFWVLPLLFALFGILSPLLFQFMPEENLRFFFPGETPEVDIDGARATLQVVAGGVITITSLVFSLAFVALSITAQQLSPRVVDYVVEERVTQILVGLSLATFLFSAITLSFGITGGALRLATSSYVALTMAAASMAMVVIFSHRMTRIMRAEDMVARLGRTFVDAVRGGPESIDPEMMVDDPDAENALEANLEGGEIICATDTGYLGAVDHPGLLNWAEENDVFIQILLRENAFVLEGQPVARVAGAISDPAAIAERVTHFVNLTERRVIGETPEYEGSSLSEVALRALSPGINDPATARACANRLFQGLVLLAAMPERPRALQGTDRVPRILRARQGIAEFLEDNVAPIVEAARDRTTLRHLLDLTETLGSIANRKRDRMAIAALCELIRNSDPAPELHLAAADPRS